MTADEFEVLEWGKSRLALRHRGGTVEHQSQHLQYTERDHAYCTVKFVKFVAGKVSVMLLIVFSRHLH
jgi:hypothetical protein